MLKFLISLGVFHKVGRASSSGLSIGGRRRYGNRDRVPDLTAVLRNGTVRTELARLGDTDDGHLVPLALISVGGIDAILSINVRVEVEAGDVVIATVSQLVKDGVNNISVTEEAGLDGVEDSLQSTTDIVSLALVNLLTDAVNAIDALTENEHVLLTNLFGDLDVGTIHGTNNEATVHDELHVGRARCLSTSGRDVLGQLSGGNDDLGGTDVVVGQENNLEKVTDAGVVVDLVRDGSDQLDESLSVPIARGSLTTDHDDTGLELARALILRSIEDHKVSVDNVQDVHQLALVFVYTLHLDVVHGIDGDHEAGVLLNPGGELLLVGALDVDELLLEVGVSRIGHQLLEVLERGNPLVNTTEGIGKQIRQGRVAAVDPTTRGDTVGLVLELAGVELIELTEDGGSQKVSMELSDTVDSVRADDGEVGHTDLLGEALLNETHAHNLLLIAGELLSKLLEVNVVNEIDELEVTRKEAADQVDGPLLKSLWKYGMVGVREGVVDNAPGLFEAEHLLIDKNTEQLNRGNGGMSIVQLHAVLLREESESIVVLLFISADHVVDGG